MSVENFTDPEKWALQQWGDVDLGDSRRTNRAVEVGAALAQNPGASLPAQMESWNQLKAAYRLLGEEDVTHTALSQPHWQSTLCQAKQSGAPVVLFIQDTTELDYTAKKRTSGLGHIGDGRGQGIMLHTCLAVVPRPLNPDILGIAGQLPWMRPSMTKAQKCALKQSKNPSDSTIEHTEADIWGDIIESIGIAPAPNTEQTWVSVGDRGSDIFSYLRRSMKLGWQCLMRVTQNRVIVTPDNRKTYLKQFARSLSSMTQKTIALRGRDGEQSRQVDLEIAWEAITVKPPTSGPERKELPIAGWCIRCWEVPDDDSSEGLEWILFTTVPVTDAAVAKEQLDWYATRWVIEEYHKCLKSGCAIEQRQLETGDGLLRLLGFLAIIAVRLLQLRTASRMDGAADARQFVPNYMLKVLCARLGLFKEQLTLSEFWKSVARLGGFIGRKSDGSPGWQTLWRGWARLQDMCWAAQLAAQQF